jgi:hypothetical protein
MGLGSLLSGCGSFSSINPLNGPNSADGEHPNVLRWYLGLADRPTFESGYAIFEDMGPILQP